TERPRGARSGRLRLRARDGRDRARGPRVGAGQRPARDRHLPRRRTRQGGRMSTPGRPKGEYRSAQHEGAPMSTPGRPKGEYRSAQHEGAPMIRSVARTRAAEEPAGADVTRAGLDQSRLTNLLGYAATRASDELKKSFQTHLGPL